MTRNESNTEAQIETFNDVVETIKDEYEDADYASQRDNQDTYAVLASITQRDDVDSIMQIQTEVGITVTQYAFEGRSIVHVTVESGCSFVLVGNLSLERITGLDSITTVDRTEYLESNLMSGD